VVDPADSIVVPAGDVDVTVSAAEATPVLPATSIAFAVKLWLPATRAAVVKLHAPLLLAVTAPTWFVPSNTSTELFASAVPTSKNALLLAGADEAITGAFGAIVSTVTASAAEAALVVPDVLVAVAVSTCVASVKTDVMYPTIRRTWPW